MALLTFGIAGCATTDPVVIPCPEPLPLPQPPAEALVHSADRSRLPDNFTELPLDEALRILLRAHLFDIETLTTLEAKHETLKRYIDEGIK